MRRSVSSRIAVIVALVAMVPLATSCLEPPTGGSPAGEVAHRGGTLRLVQEAPRTLDPLGADSVYESLPVNQVFDTLIDFDPSLNLTPALAETWTVSPDGLTMVFRLRAAVRFHHGETLEADDVVFSIRRHLRPRRDADSLAFPYLLAIDGAEAFAAGRRDDLPGLVATDPRTVTVRLARPAPSFLEVLALDGMSVVPRRRFEELGPAEFGRAPSGTGPFRVEDWREDELVLAAFREHWGGPPLLDAVSISFVGDDERDHGVARFLAGELDVLEPPSDALSGLRDDPTVRVRVYQELSLAFLGLNAAEAPLDLQFVRRAIAMAIDRRALVAASPALRREAVGVVPPGMAGYSPEDKTPAHDLDGARRLLAEHGHPGGAGLPPVRLDTASRNDAVTQVVESIRADLAAIGLRLEVRDVTWSELGAGLDAGTTPAFLLGWVADLTHPDAFVRPLFASDGAANYFAYRDEVVDDLLRRGLAERNPAEFARLYRELERRVLADAPLVPLYHTRGVVAVRSHVIGFDPGPLGVANVSLERVSLVTAGAP